MTHYDYHIFTDNVDEFSSTKKEAFEIVSLWKKEGYENIRVYEHKYEDGELIDENCLYRKGGFPW